MTCTLSKWKNDGVMNGKSGDDETAGVNVCHCYLVVVEFKTTAEGNSVRHRRSVAVPLPSAVLRPQCCSLDVGLSDFHRRIPHSPAPTRVRNFRPGEGFLGKSYKPLLLEMTS